MNDIEEQKKRDLARFEEEIKKVSKEFPQYKIKEFTFNGMEQQMLAEQSTIEVLAGKTQDRILNQVCLKRVGLSYIPGMQIRYSVLLGRFVVFVPKV